jgi:hypothetical protein
MIDKAGLQNLCEMIDFFQKNCPLTVGEFMDSYCPKRATDVQQQAQAENLLKVLRVFDGDDLFDIDRPIIESSVIRGQSENGKVACALLIRLAAAKGLF